MKSFREQQRERNQAAQDAWDRFTAHRERVMRSLNASAEALSDTLQDVELSLALFGAGNCLDVELDALVSRFDQLTLVDCDQASVRAALASAELAPPQRDKIQIVELDVTGAFARLDELLDSNPAEAGLLGGSHVLSTLESSEIPGPPHGPVACAASLCLLSQLIDRLNCYVGLSDERFLDAVHLVRNRHLEQLLRWTRPRGAVHVVVDFTSSETAAELRGSLPKPLREIVVDCFQRGDFFTGLHPGAIREWFLTSPQAADLVESVEIEPPWLWDFGPRFYAVTCLTVRRSEAPGAVA